MIMINGRRRLPVITSIDLSRVSYVLISTITFSEETFTKFPEWDFSLFWMGFLQVLNTFDNPVKLCLVFKNFFKGAAAELIS